jgi:HD superfamily phosphodiesterase
MPATVTNRLSTEQRERLNAFLRESTRSFDSSHNWEHGETVRNLAVEIANGNGIEYYEEDVLETAALLHDVRDHKYPDSITQEELQSFLTELIGSERSERVLRIIANISYSKQVAGLLESLPAPDSIYRDTISDADKLEALGEIGIERCETLTRERGGSVPADVVKHCHEKLLRLLPDGYIVTPHGRGLAEPRHSVIQQYVLRNTPVVE